MLFSKIIWKSYFDSEGFREPVITSKIESDVCGNMVNKVMETPVAFFHKSVGPNIFIIFGF